MARSAPERRCEKFCMTSREGNSSCDECPSDISPNHLLNRVAATSKIARISNKPSVGRRNLVICLLKILRLVLSGWAYLSHFKSKNSYCTILFLYFCSFVDLELIMGLWSDNCKSFINYLTKRSDCIVLVADPELRRYLSIILDMQTKSPRSFGSKAP